MRRFLLSLVVAAAAVMGLAALSGSTFAQSQSPAPAQPPAAAPAAPSQAAGLLPPLAEMLAERSLGRADAPVTVIEYASLTCPHCAAFHTDVLPQVKRELIDTGRVRIVFRDFPLDRVALAGAMVARCLPATRYAGFFDLLMAEQQSWAYRGDPMGGLKRMAALAGMSDAAFDACLRTEALQRGVLEIRLQGEREHNVDSTPTFVAGSRRVAGNRPFEQFVRELGLR